MTFMIIGLPSLLLCSEQLLWRLHIVRQDFYVKVVESQLHRLERRSITKNIKQV